MILFQNAVAFQSVITLLFYSFPSRNCLVTALALPSVHADSIDTRELSEFVPGNASTLIHMPRRGLDDIFCTAHIVYEAEDEQTDVPFEDSKAALYWQIKISGPTADDGLWYRPHDDTYVAKEHTVQAFEEALRRDISAKALFVTTNWPTVEQITFFTPIGVSAQDMTSALYAALGLQEVCRAPTIASAVREGKCNICWEDIASLRRVACKKKPEHVYHAECVDFWQSASGDEKEICCLCLGEAKNCTPEYETSFVDAHE